MRQFAQYYLIMTVMSGFLLCAGAAWGQGEAPARPNPAADRDHAADCYAWHDPRVSPAQCWTACPVGAWISASWRRFPPGRHSAPAGTVYQCRASTRLLQVSCRATEPVWQPVSVGHGAGYRVVRAVARTCAPKSRRGHDKPWRF
jgi:hypothetical protein